MAAPTFAGILGCCAAGRGRTGVPDHDGLETVALPCRHGAQPSFRSET